MLCQQEGIFTEQVSATYIKHTEALVKHTEGAMYVKHTEGWGDLEETGGSTGSTAHAHRHGIALLVAQCPPRRVVVR